jgi:hypothetical protein
VVSLNVGGVTHSASARDFLLTQTPTTWLAGPLVTEWMVTGPLKTASGTEHPHLHARFNVRAYGGLDSVRVDVIVENTWALNAGQTNYTYDATLTVDGRGTVLSQSNVTHYRQARWRRTAWWRADPSVHVAHDRYYLEQTRVVPTYDPALDPAAANFQSALRSVFNEWNGASPNVSRLMATGLTEAYMPGAGGRRDIAPLPGWTARYLISQDEQAKIPMLGTSEQAGSFSIHIRDKTTDRPVSLNAYPQLAILSNQPFPAVPCSASDVFCDTPYEPEVAHQPSLSYVPYLVTGDHFHLEELQFWANWNLFYWGNHGGAQGLMVYDQVRAQAWGLRTLGHAAYATPDSDPLKAYFVEKLNNNISWFNQNYTNNPQAPALGYLLHNNDSSSVEYFSTWMDDFFTWSVGHVVNLGFTQARSLFDYKARFPVGRMTDPGYCWVLASTYWTFALNAQNAPFPSWMAYRESVIRNWRQSFGIEAVGSDSAPGMSDARIDALIAAECNSQTMADLLGLRRGAMIGLGWHPGAYVANLQPAVAIAAELSAQGAATAWQVFSGRTSQPDPTDDNYSYNVEPEWAIVPRVP